MVARLGSAKVYWQLDGILHGHVRYIVCGENARTLKVLHGITRGCWVVTMNWLLESAKCGRWLDPAPFEAAQWFPGAARARQCIARGDPPLFCGRRFWIQGETHTPAFNLREIVECLGGAVVRDSRAADVIVVPQHKSGTPVRPGPSAREALAVAVAGAFITSEDRKSVV